MPQSFHWIHPSRSACRHIQLGRVLVPEDEHAEVMPAVVSDPFWKRRFAGDHAIIGRNLTLNGYPFVVVGVTPEEFSGLTIDTSPDIRVPATADRWFGKESDPPIYAQTSAASAPA